MSFSAKAYFKPGHGDEPVVLRSGDDADGLVDALLGESFDHSMAMVYIAERPRRDGFPDHELGVAVDNEAAMGGLWYLGADGSWYSAGAGSDRDEVFYCYMGNDRDFPGDSLITIDAIRAALKEFLASGGERPRCVRWQPHRVESPTP